MHLTLAMQNLPLTYAVVFTSFPGISISASNGTLFIAPPGLSYLNVVALVS